MITRYLEKLIDWKQFELFVADLYSDSEELIVEHDVTELGKSGAKRQVDVKVTQLSKLHTYITIIECKRWKKKVTRQIIDVMYASVEDLNANKGVIFTTRGYEKGAIQYAQSKNIDIFLIRDIFEEEWGKPGRIITLFLQIYSGKLENFSAQNTKYLSFNRRPPTSPSVKFNIRFSKEQEYPEDHQLVSIKGTKGPNLVKILIEVRNSILEQTMNQFNHLLLPSDKEVKLGLKTKVTLDFSDQEFKFLKFDNGLIELNKFDFDLLQLISQSKVVIDRLESSDFALIVENYISKRKNFVSKPKNENRLILSDPIEKKKEVDESEIVQNNSIIKIITEHYVACEINDSTPIRETNELNVKLNFKK